jgi:hypothetical protein
VHPRPLRPRPQVPGPLDAPGDLPGGLVDAVVDLPDPGPGLEPVGTGGGTVIGVHVGGHHDVAQRQSRPQAPGHPDEEHRQRPELPDGPLGDDRGRVVALPGEGQHDLATAADRADLEAGAGHRRGLAQVGEQVPDGVVLDVQSGEHNDRRPVPSTFVHAINPSCQGHINPDDRSIAVRPGRADTSS